MVPKCAPICIFKKVNTTAKDWCMQWKLVPSVHRGMCGTSIKELQTSFLLNSLSSCFMILSFIRQDFLWKELSINGNKTRDTNFKNTLLTWKMCGKKNKQNRGLADVCDLTVFTRQSAHLWKNVRSLSFAFKIFYFLYMCLILHVSMSVVFFVFYNFLQLMVFLSL